MSEVLPAVLIKGVRHLTTKTAASVVSRTPHWLRRRLTKPGAPAHRIIGSRIVFPEADFLAWIDSDDVRNPRVESRPAFRG